MRSSNANHIELWKVPLHGSVLRIKTKQKALYNTGMHHLHIGLVCNAPQRSAFELHSKSVPTLDLLQQNIAGISTDDGLMVIAGDFNARTGDAQDSLSCEDLSDLLDSSNPTYIVDDP